MFENRKKNCITAFDVQEYEEKREALVCYFNGVTCVYQYNEENYEKVFFAYHFSFFAL